MRFLVRSAAPVVVTMFCCAFSISRAGDAPGRMTPKLHPIQVSQIAEAAVRELQRPIPYNFKIGVPEFSESINGWTVWFRQSSPPYVVDGDLIVVVNDKTRRACVDQAMMPPRFCE
jgi:hypothetical protein